MHAFGQKGVVPLAQRLSLSPEEASAMSCIGLSSIRQAINGGRLIAHKHGRRTVILPDDLKAFLQMLPKAGRLSRETAAAPSRPAPDLAHHNDRRPKRRRA